MTTTPMDKDEDSTSMPRYPLQSVDNALRALLHFRVRDEIRLIDLAQELNIAPSTAHRLLAMLAHHGLVRQDEQSRVYRAGPALIGLGLNAVSNLEIRRRTRPHMEALAREVDETVTLMALEGADMRVVECVEGTRPIRVAARIGILRPAHVTSVGKAILATRDPADISRMFPDEALPARTRNSISSRTELLRELDQVRAEGYAVNLQESDVELCAVGVALGENTVPQWGLGVSVPHARTTAESLHTIATAAKRVVATIDWHHP